MFICVVNIHEDRRQQALLALDTYTADCRLWFSAVSLCVQQLSLYCSTHSTYMMYILTLVRDSERDYACATLSGRSSNTGVSYSLWFSGHIQPILLVRDSERDYACATLSGHSSNNTGVSNSLWFSGHIPHILSQAGLTRNIVTK